MRETGLSDLMLSTSAVHVQVTKTLLGLEGFDKMQFENKVPSRFHGLKPMLELGDESVVKSCWVCRGPELLPRTHVLLATACVIIF